MHQRPTNSKSKSNDGAHSSRVKRKQKNSTDSTTGGRKKPYVRSNINMSNTNMSLSRKTRNLHGICSWLGSFTKLALVIGFFVLCVYLYDKQIIYGFAQEAGWIEPNSDILESDTAKVAKHDVDTDPGRDSQLELPHNRQLPKVVNNIEIIKHDQVSRDQNRQKHVEVDNEVERRPSIIEENMTDGAIEKPRHYHVLQVLTNTHQKPHLKTRFDVCIRSILTKASVDLHFFFVVDKPSEEFIIECLQQITDEGICRSHFQFTILLIDDLGKNLLPYVGELQAQLQGSHPYYHDTIFFLSLGIHREVLPDDVKQLIVMDTDLKFMSDINQLFDLFNDFSDENVMGIAHEQQPVYRHLFSLFRSQNKGTRVGDPPPDGLTGFNSGVMLLDFGKMRGSKAYNEILTVDYVKEFANMYHFKGHLGDQDFFSLASMEKPELFYVLPCSWNKQLCIWWKDKGYKDVFDLYFNCPEPIHVYHGNCNTPIPY